MNPVEGEFVSTKEAAALIGVSVRTIQLWVEAGALQAWKTQGGHRRIVKSSINELLRKRNEQTTPLATDTQGITMRLVIVEDDPHLQAMYELAVCSLPFPVDIKTASDGYSGLVRIGQFHPHVIIADLNLPGLDGFRMIRALKEAPESRDAQLLVVSALTNDDILDRGGLPDGVQILSKPLSMSRLEKLLQQSYGALVATPPQFFGTTHAYGA